jgi:histidinol-phosphate aminotransferase
VLGCGSGEILRMADMAFLAPDRSLVVAEPTFEAVLGYARVPRATATKVPLTADFRHDLPRMAAACDERTGLVYVCNPNNPTATIVTRDELLAFLKRVPTTATVLVDEAYFHFVDDMSYASATEFLANHPNVVVARTFSKIYGMAGMRLGYALGSKENVAALAAHMVFSNANASLADAEYVRAQSRRMNETRRWLCAELQKDGRRFLPSHANFVMIHIGSDVGPVIDAFKGKGVLVGRRFPTMETWLRVSIGTEDETKVFLEALRAIVPAVKAVA